MSDELITKDYEAIFLQEAPLLDVRAPVEFAKGAFPTSSNIPLLDDNARHLVGIEYKEVGQQSAIELGATLLPESDRESLVSQWIDHASKHPEGYLYCFRGGLRSRITQRWLSDAGCDYPIVSGGYKALRQFLINSLEQQCQQIPFCLIGGRTGTGKTRLLQRLTHTIDLEGLAKHRGSSFGRMVVPQPSNIDFENAISIALLKLAQHNPPVVYLEDEARMIGSACIPAPMREQTQKAPVAILTTELDTRVQFAIEDYVVDLLAVYRDHHGMDDGFQAFAGYHRESLERVKKRFGGVRYKQALELLDRALQTHRETGETHDYNPFIKMLLTDYYDPMYDYQMQAKQDRVVFTGDAPELIDWCADNKLFEVRA